MNNVPLPYPPFFMLTFKKNNFNGFNYNEILIQNIVPIIVSFLRGTEKGNERNEKKGNANSFEESGYFCIG